MRSPTPVSLALAFSILLAGPALAQTSSGSTLATSTVPPEPPPTHADSIRGGITPERAWWDVAFYDLRVRINPADSTIRGVSQITYRVLQPHNQIQIDLQRPLQIDSFVQRGRRLDYRRDGDAFFVYLVAPQRPGLEETISIYYWGRPHRARNAPWDGGIVWGSDSLGGSWIATACQGAGASLWWPTKDTQADEPDSQRVVVTVPDSVSDVSNGRLRSVTRNGDGTTSYEWFVSQPINNYDIAINTAEYAHLKEAYYGEGGRLTLNYWPLAYHLETAQKQFTQVKPMLRCFEHWFGPYPWYQDGYQLVETPHLGMEHQSGIAYGNQYLNGYLGHDLSATGQGLDWDYIIVHESAHEWWGNNITTTDLADMWVHESFATLAEGLYVECLRGKEAGAEYIIGYRKGIKNDKPIIPEYGLNRHGSGDMYPKGANMLHTIRQIVGDDEKWRGILRGLNQTFRHQVVTGRQVEDYISQQSGVNLSTVFQQYLTTTMIPTLEYKIEGATLSYRWADAVADLE
ncbi:MAG: M1 family metallopeptidase, partial [Gemmatimonadales bacterium]